VIRPFVLALGVASCARIVGIGDVEPQDGSVPIVDGSNRGSGSACASWGGAGCVTSLAAGVDTTCATTTIEGSTDNRVYCWGESPADGSAHMQPVRDLGGAPFTVSASAAGMAGVYCVVDNGSAACWGDGVDGQLQSTVSSTTPVAMIGSNSIAIAAGGDHVCTLDSGGTVACWGADNFDQLGPTRGSDTCGALACSKHPLTVLSGVNQLGAGDSHTCALVGMAVECWGDNGQSQLGQPGVNKSASPQPVVDGNFVPISAVAIAVGASHTCALGDDGTYACWGEGAFGQLGNGAFDGVPSATYQAAPVPLVAIAAGNANTCAIDMTGQVWCWGDNAAAVDGTVPAVMGSAALPVTITGLTDARLIAVGTRHACAALQTGAIVCWGDNTHGELGANACSPCTGGSSAPCSATPVIVPPPM
jgi:alpha-tubulin suppressor-like RCC1 family protein